MSGPEDKDISGPNFSIGIEALQYVTSSQKKKIIATIEQHLDTQDDVKKEGAMLEKHKPQQIRLTPNSPQTILQCLRSRTLCELRGSPKRSLLLDRRRLGDCNTRVLPSGT